MAAKKKDAKRKKHAAREREQSQFNKEEVAGEEIEASFPEMYEKVCKELGAESVPKIINIEVADEEEGENGSKKLTKKKSKREKKSMMSKSDSSPAHAASSGAASTGGSTAIIAPAATDDTCTSGEALNLDEDAAANAEATPQVHIRPPTISVTYYDPKKKMMPQSLIFEAVPMEEAFVLALDKCLPIYPSLCSLTFKKCDFPGELVNQLSEVLRCAENIKELTFDNSPHPEQNYYTLVREGRYLELLIFRGCGIDDEGARTIALELCYREDYKETTTLFYLNLSVNMIGDRGARHLARALRTNRTLLALTLTANLITDFGAIALANSLKDFELNEDEVLDRRQHIYHRFKAYLEMRDEILEELKASKVLEEADQKPALVEVPRRGKKKKNVVEHAAEKPKEVQLSTEAHLELWKQTLGCELPGYDYPFVNDVFKSERRLWSRGNLRLSHLNLSYNAITSLGAEKFLQVASYQARVRQVSPKLAQTGFTGLTNLILQGNLFPIDIPEMLQIQAYITNSSDIDLRRSDHSFLGEAPNTAEKPTTHKGPLPYVTSFLCTADAGTQCAF